jgi:DNA-binding IclR family transcriptional regulator
MNDSSENKLPAQPNLSLIGGIECLQAVTGSDTPLGSREVARLLGLEHTRVNRLLGTLCFLGLLEKTPERKYAPGSAIHVLAAQSLRASRLLPAALPFLQDIISKDFIVAMGVLWRRQVCYLFYATPGGVLETALGNHGLYPAESSGLGHLLLSEKPPEYLPNHFQSDLYCLPKSLYDKLLKEIGQARSQGYASLETSPGVTSLAVGIGAPAQAALAFSGKMSAEEKPRLLQLLRDTAKKIAAQAGLDP